jgi:hypothetical protein
MRLAFLLFLAGIALTLALTARVDSDAPDEGTPGDAAPDGRNPPPRRTPMLSMGGRAVVGLRGNAALRAFTGFLTLFLAFRLRTHPLPGIAATTAVGLVIAVAVVGGGIGTALGALVRRRRPETVIAGTLVALTLTTAWSAIAYGIVPILAVALIAGLGQGLGKLCLDALIQDEVPDAVRTSAFARSETVLQLGWVIGGAIGLALPLSGAWGLGVATLLTAAATAATITGLARLRRAGAPR